MATEVFCWQESFTTQRTPVLTAYDSTVGRSYCSATCKTLKSPCEIQRFGPLRMPPSALVSSSSSCFSPSLHKFTMGDGAADVWETNESSNRTSENLRYLLTTNATSSSTRSNISFKFNKNYGVLKNVALIRSCQNPGKSSFVNVETCGMATSPSLSSSSSSSLSVTLVSSSGTTEPGSSSSTSSSTSKPRPPIFVLSDKPDRVMHLKNWAPESRRPTRVQEDSNEDDEGYSQSNSNPNHRSGYVALIGEPNVGKSTLMNRIVGQKLSIVTHKPQTTRHRILGISSTSDYQMILYDTPGVIAKRMNKLDEMMMQNVRTAALNADCVLVVADASAAPQKVTDSLEEGALKIIQTRPSLLVLNKKDVIKPGEIAKRLQWYGKFSGFDQVLAVSARYGHGIDELKSWLVSKLPLGPPYYPKGDLSDQPEKFFASEIIREKIFLQYMKEIPYVSQVNVIKYIERVPPAKDFIEVEIVVEKESQRGIMIGKQGQAMKTLATAARLDIEDFVGREVFLDIKVKVKEDWRANEDLLKYYGYSL